MSECALGYTFNIFNACTCTIGLTKTQTSHICMNIKCKQALGLCVLASSLNNTSVSTVYHYCSTFSFGHSIENMCVTCNAIYWQYKAPRTVHKNSVCEKIYWTNGEDMDLWGCIWKRYNNRSKSLKPGNKRYIFTTAYMQLSFFVPGF